MTIEQLSQLLNEESEHPRDAVSTKIASKYAEYLKAHPEASPEERLRAINKISVTSVSEIEKKIQDSIDEIVALCLKSQERKWNHAADDMNAQIEERVAEYSRRHPDADEHQTLEEREWIAFRTLFSSPLNESTERLRFRCLAEQLERALMPLTDSYHDGDESELASVEKHTSGNSSPIFNPEMRKIAESLIRFIPLLDRLDFETQEWWRTVALIERMICAIEIDRKLPLSEFAFNKMRAEEARNKRGGRAKAEQAIKKQLILMKALDLSGKGVSKSNEAGVIAKALNETHGRKTKAPNESEQYVSETYVRKVLKEERTKQDVLQHLQSSASPPGAQQIYDLARKYNVKEEYVYELLVKQEREQQ